MAISFLDPRGEPATTPLDYELSDPLEDGAVIALLANGFPDSVTFLDHVADAIAAQEPGLRFERYDKGNASALAKPEMLDAITETCQAVVAAYGH